MATNKQSDDPMSQSEQNLQPLEVSDRGNWGENTGRYTNEEGQVCELRVRGTDVKRVKEYMDAVRVSFKVTSLNEKRPEPEASPEEVDEKTRVYIEDGLKKLDRHPELDLEIVITIVETQGIELPYELNAVIDPPISGGATDRYVTRDHVHEINITLNASVGGVTGSLNDGPAGQADTFPPNPPSDSALFSKTVSPASPFSFTVTGLKQNNDYSFSTSATLVRG